MRDWSFGSLGCRFLFGGRLDRKGLLLFRSSNLDDSRFGVLECLFKRILGRLEGL